MFVTHGGVEMRKWSSLIIAVLMLASVILTGCGGGAAGEFKVGLVTDVGRINDRSFNQSAWEGVLAAAEELGLEEGVDFKYVETKDSKDYHDNLRQFTEEGFDVIVSITSPPPIRTARATEAWHLPLHDP